MSPVFVDTNIPMYAAGSQHRLREPSRAVIRSLASGQLAGVTSADVLQEILHRYLRTGAREKGFRVFDAFHRVMKGRILPVDDVDVQRARELAEAYPGLNVRDLVHVAVMEREDITGIVTADQKFDAVSGIRRIDPADFHPPS